MREQLEEIRKEALAAIEAADTLPELDAIRVRFSGKKGKVTAILKQMGKLSAEERPVMGALANEVRADIDDALEKKIRVVNEELLEKLHVVSDYEGRSINRHILVLIRKDIEQYEKEHGKIE